MNSTHAAFQLLTLLLSANGPIIPAKSNLLIEFLNDYCDELTFDPNHEIIFLANLNPDEKNIKLSNVIEKIHQSESKDNKEALLSYAIGMMSVNTTITEKDENMLNQVANYWDVDLHLL